MPVECVKHVYDLYDQVKLVHIHYLKVYYLFNSFRIALKKSEDSFYELKDSTDELKERLTAVLEEKDSLQADLDKTESAFNELQSITEKARELLGSPAILTGGKTNSMTGENLGENPVCGICFEDYDETDHKRKIFNPCGHVACRTCATKLLNSYCHICRESVDSLIPFYR